MNVDVTKISETMVWVLMLVVPGTALCQVALGFLLT